MDTAAEMRKDDSELQDDLPFELSRVSESDAQPLANGRGDVRALFSADGILDMHVIELRPEAPPGPFHLHPASDNIYFILEGEIWIRYLHGRVLVRPGDLVRIPPGVPHGVTCREATGAKLIELYVPPGPVRVLIAEDSAP